MATSYVSYVGNGATTQFSVTFPYLATTHVKVYIDGVEDTTFTWVNSTTVQPTSTPGNGVIVKVARETPTSALVDFVDGSVLTESDLDTATLQSLYVAEENADLATDALGLDADLEFTARSKRIKNVATPTAAADAVTKAYADAISAAAGNVPTPDNPGDDGFSLQASGGTFDWVKKTPLTTNGDLLVQSGGADARLAVGSDDGMVLKVVSGAPAWAYQGYELVEYVDLTNGGANDTASFILSHSMEAGYTYRLVIRDASGTAGSFYVGFSLRNVATTWRKTAGDWTGSYQIPIVPGTTDASNNGLNSYTTGTGVWIYLYSGFVGSSAGETQSGVVDIFGAGDSGVYTKWLIDSQVAISNLGARCIGAGHIDAAAEAHDLIEVWLNTGNFDGGKAFLYRMKEPA